MKKRFLTKYLKWAEKCRASSIYRIIPLVFTVFFASTTISIAGDFGGELIIGYKDEPEKINPISLRYTISAALNLWIYDGLVTLTPEGNIKPRIAKKWEVYDGGRRWRFYLNENVHFHNGMKCTSRDVKFTYDLGVNQARKYRISRTLENLKEIKIIDDYTIDFIFFKPNSSFLMNLYFAGILPEKLWKGKSIEKNKHNYEPVGTGAYIFKKWEPNKEIVLEANDEYFRGRPYIHKIIARKYDDLSTLWAKLETGEIDFVWNEVLPDDFERLKKNPRLQTFTAPDFYNYVLVFNFKKKMFKNKRVRKAFDLAINKEEIVKNVLLGYGFKSTGIYSPEMLNLKPEDTRQNYNPEEAYRILLEEGWREQDDGSIEKDGEDFRVEILIDEGHILKEKAFLLIQKQLREVGIDSYVTSLPLPELYARAAIGNFDLIFVNYNIILDLPVWHWHSSATKSGYNFGGYSNKELDRLLEMQSIEKEDANKVAIKRQIQDLVADDLPCIFIFFKKSLGAINERFKGADDIKDTFWWENQHLYIPKEKQRHSEK